MTPADRDRLNQLRDEIERLVRLLRHPVVVEAEETLFDLTAADWRLSLDNTRLILEVWNRARSIVRRVEDIAYRDHARLGIFVRRPGGRQSEVLEFRDLERVARPTSVDARRQSLHQLVATVKRNYPGWICERVTNHSDREHSFSSWYTRGLARQGRMAWAFLGLGEDEDAAAADHALAQALIWLDWLRTQANTVSISGLKLFLPPSGVVPTAHRAAYLNRRAVDLEILEWQPEKEGVRSIDILDFGNVETRLIPHRQGRTLLERHEALLSELLGELRSGVEALPDAAGGALSLRVLGLEIARVEGQLAPRISYGIAGDSRQLSERDREELHAFVGRVLQFRRARSPAQSHPYYRLQPERWLESLLARDITKVDPALLPTCVYPQVPAFAAFDRGVIDILGITRQGRLATIELKLSEEINLPLQALDYWLRVKWLQERHQFQSAGYFPGLEILPVPPVLYLVCPAFRFHSTTHTLVRYLDPSVEVVQVGINQSWRDSLKVLFRRQLHGTPGTSFTTAE